MTALRASGVLLALVLGAGCSGDATPAASPAPGPASPAPGGRPRIVAEPAVFDFGEVLPGKVLAKEVVVRNHGDGDLVIAKVDTTCNCTVVGDYAKTLVPGAGTTLRVSLTTPEVAGRTAQAVRITSNDPDQPQLHIDVVATVVAAPARRAKD